MTITQLNAARDSLKQFCRQMKGTTLTCHVYNPHSDLFWLFSTAGRFRYEHVVRGPLTHPGQKSRFTVPGDFSECDNDEGIEVHYFNYPPRAELIESILLAESFNQRENVRTPIRIRLYHPHSQQNHDQPKPEIFIFLNFSTVLPEDARRPMQLVIKETMRTLRPFLLELADTPRLESHQAWLLRSVELDLRARFANIRLGGLSERGENPEDFFHHIAVAIAERLVPRPRRGAKTIHCTICATNANHQLQILGKFPKSLAMPMSYVNGIVANVCRTGQFFYIRDVDTYKTRVRNEGPSLSLPPYVVCCRRTKCELAIPLIIKGRVIGVVNLESDKVDAYDDSHVLMLFQLCTSIGLYMRLLGLLRDSSIAIRLQQDLLSLSDVRAVYRHLMLSCRELGYQLADVWDNQNGCWIAADKPTLIRPEGFTRWVLDSGEPIAVADIRRTDGESDHRFKIFLRRKKSDTEYFDPKDERADFPVQAINVEVLKLIEDTPEGILTDLAFPICYDGRVEAVLWAKCRRPYSTLLDDECWCLAELCKATTTALCVIRGRKMV